MDPVQHHRVLCRGGPSLLNPDRYGRPCGVGRGRAVGAALGVAVGPAGNCKLTDARVSVESAGVSVVFAHGPEGQAVGRVDVVSRCGG